MVGNQLQENVLLSLQWTIELILWVVSTTMLTKRLHNYVSEVLNPIISRTMSQSGKILCMIPKKASKVDNRTLLAPSMTRFIPSVAASCSTEKDKWENAQTKWQFTIPLKNDIISWKLRELMCCQGKITMLPFLDNPWSFTEVSLKTVKLPTRCSTLI